jgi:CheY-like chemotaxis protein
VGNINDSPAKVHFNQIDAFLGAVRTWAAETRKNSTESVDFTADGRHNDGQGGLMDLRDATILIVDDEAVLLDIFANWFRSQARAVFAAENGAQALKILAAEKVHVVLTDIRMPVMDGVTLLKKIHASFQPAPRVIFVSGFADVDAREVYELGADAFIEKPVRREILIGAARRCLEDRGTLWRVPWELCDTPTLREKFDSFDAALEKRQIAFGRGGFCISCAQPLADGPINIQIEFAGDSGDFYGQGLLRWLSPAERMAGVELTFVAEQYRARVARMALCAIPYIPRTTCHGNRQSVS